MATWVGPLLNTRTVQRYTPGRARPVQYVVIHTTEGSEGPVSAEAGVAYDKRRTDGTSTHIFVDSDTALMEVRYTDRAHAARFHGNEIGVQIELCGTARQTAAQWHDQVSLAMLRLAAVEVAAICRAHQIPPVRLSVAQVRAAYHAPALSRPKGICGHYDVTRAYPEDGGSHTDPGPAFPWDEFLGLVAAELQQEEVIDMAVAYKVESTDPEYNGRVWLSNGVNRRGPIRQPKAIIGPARAGSVEQVLTDAMRTSVSATMTWEQYLDAVAGPELHTPPAGGEHTHEAITTVGPAAG